MIEVPIDCYDDEIWTDSEDTGTLETEKRTKAMDEDTNPEHEDE